MSGKTISIAAIGFSEQELRILKTVGSLSRSGHPYHYALTTDIPRSGLAALICNADDPEALARWNIYRAAFPDALLVMASRRDLPDGPYATLHRPLSAREILRTLDQAFETATADSAQPAQQRGIFNQMWQRRTVEGIAGSDLQIA